MNKRIKRGVAFIITLLLAVSMLSGCGKSNTTEANSTAETNEQASTAGTGEVKEETPIEKQTITIALQTYSNITDYKDNYLTKKLEAELGIDIEFYLLSADSAEAATQLSLLFTSGENVPDVICTNALTEEAILGYGSSEFFIPLNDYLSDANKAPNFNAIESEEDKAFMLKAAASADGNIYGLPSFEPETWNLTPYRQYINETWLATLGLSMPTTTEEFYNVLTAFATKDPNGNGIADEISLYGITAGTYGENITIPLMNSFIYYPSAKASNVVLTLADDGKTVISPFTQEGWKQGLEYMNRLCEEGLMPASVFTDDKTQFMAVLNNEGVNLVGALSSGSLSRWTDFDNNVNGQQFTMMPPLKGPSGIAYSPYIPYSPGRAWFITSSCENPDLAFTLGDLFYRNDISNTVRYGEEGVDWTTDSTLITNPDFKKAILKDIWGENNNKFWRNINPRYVPIDDYNTWLPANPDFEAKSNIFRYEMNPKYNYNAHPSAILQNVKYTNEEAQSQAEIIVNISSYVSESMAQFITGARPLSDWDNYLKELDTMGLSVWIDNTQAAFDRQ